MAEVVHPDGEVDAGGFDGGQPDAGPECVAGDGCAGLGGEQQGVSSDVVGGDVGGDVVEPVGSDGEGAGLVVLGVGLGDHPGAGGGVPAGHFEAP